MFALDFGMETKLFTDQFEKKTILGSYRFFPPDRLLAHAPLTDLTRYGIF